MEQAQTQSLLRRMRMVSAGLVAVLLVGGLKSLLDVLQGLGFHNWLVLLFQINLGRVDYDSLKVLNPLDLLILLLVGITLIGLWPVLARGRKVWISIAVAQPFLGIVLLMATHLLGRSAVMGGGLVAAFLMLRTASTRPRLNEGPLDSSRGCMPSTPLPAATGTLTRGSCDRVALTSASS